MSQDSGGGGGGSQLEMTEFIRDEILSSNLWNGLHEMNTGHGGYIMGPSKTSMSSPSEPGTHKVKALNKLILKWFHKQVFVMDRRTD